jgi:predicted DNA-binding transcriptional regulator AlpA
MISFAVRGRSLGPRREANLAGFFFVVISVSYPLCLPWQLVLGVRAWAYPDSDRKRTRIRASARARLIPIEEEHERPESLKTPPKMDGFGRQLYATLRNWTLDTLADKWYIYVSVMRKYSTSEVAELLGIQRTNLQRAIREGLPAPKPSKVGRMTMRLWSEKDVERAREALKKK